jgi:hypothetical protein
MKITLWFILFTFFGLQFSSHATAAKINYLSYGLSNDANNLEISTNIAKPQKISWAKKLIFKVSAKKYLKNLSQKKDNFNWLGFSLGFFLGWVGVAIAYVIGGKDFGKSALKGFVTLLILACVFVILAIVLLIA